MRIERLHIDRFGKLRALDMALEPGLTLVYGGNESGKSTLMAFLRAMLYGLNGKSASLSQNDRRRYMPWGETAMGGTLVLAAEDGKTFEITRVFGQSKKMDTCRVVETATGREIPLPPGDEVGKVLLNVEENVFLDALFLPARGAKPEGSGASLTEKIRNLMGTGQEDVDLDAVRARLKEAKAGIQSRVKEKGSLFKTQSEIAALQKRLLDAAQSEQEIQALQAQIAQSTQKADAQSAARQGMEALLHERDRLQKRQSGFLQQTSALETEILGCKEELQKLEEQELSTDAQAGSPMRFLWLILAVATALGSIAAGLWLSHYAFAGLILTAGLCVLYMRAKDTQPAAASKENVGQAAVDGIMQRLSALRRERAMYLEQSQAVQAQLDKLDERLKSGVRAEEPQEREQLVQLKVKLETLLQKRGDPSEMKQALQSLTQKEKRLQDRYAALEMAESALEEAAQERQNDFLPELTRKVEALLSTITGGKYARAAISQSMELSLAEGQNALQPWEYFSGGTVEAMYLSLRLGVVQMLTRDSQPLPVMMDDPLVLLDDARARAALKALRSFSGEAQQTLLFTCQQRTLTLAGEEVRVTTMSP